MGERYASWMEKAWIGKYKQIPDNDREKEQA